MPETATEPEPPESPRWIGSRGRPPRSAALLLAGATRRSSTRSPTATTSGGTTRSTSRRSTRRPARPSERLVDRAGRRRRGPSAGPHPPAPGRGRQRQDPPDAGLPQLGPRGRPGLLRLHADDLGHRPLRPIRPEQPDRLARPALLRARRRDHGADAALDRARRELAGRRRSTGSTSSATASSTTAAWRSWSTPWPTRSSMDDRFNDVDLDLVRALLYLQSDDPRIKGRVLKYLRCEDLSTADRARPRRDRPPDLRRRPAVARPAARRADGGRSSRSR